MSKSYHDWFERVFPYLSGHGLWLKGGEINTLPLEEFDKREFKVLFTRLSTYFDTGYSFTHQILYQIAANTPGVFPDLSFLPPRNDISYFEKENVPWLLGTSTKKGALDFDLIGFSNSIVQEIINIPTMLEHSQIPLKKSERMKVQNIPLIIVGGANALYTSSIWSEDPIVDGIFVGESDQALRKILTICKDGKILKRSKAETLKILVNEVPGFIEPESPSKTKKSFIPNLNQSEALENGPIYFLSDQAGNSQLQISEGCPAFCSFCAESWDRKPYRERSAQKLFETAMRMKASMGLDHIDLYSFNFNMHAGFYQIIWDLVGHFSGVGLKSQRFDLLAHDPHMVEFQHAIEKASLTCGLEGISPRLRRYLHKNLETEDLHSSIEAILKSKAREMKVFLIATGLEEDQDFIELAGFLEHFQEIQHKLDSKTRVIFSMTPLVRFPWTPLEFEDAPSEIKITKIIERASKVIQNAGFEFRESADLSENWVSQVLVRAADSKILNALLEAIKESKFIYYREITDSFKTKFEEKLIAQGFTTNQLLKGHSLSESYNKPWANVETGVKREFLHEEFTRARSFVEIDYCLGKSWSKSKCFHCGGCSTRFHVRDIVLSDQKRTYNLEQFKERIKKTRDKSTSLFFKLNLNLNSHLIPKNIIGVALARAILLSDPKLTPFYLKNQNSPDEVVVVGDLWFELKFHESVVSYLTVKMKDQNYINNINSRLMTFGTLVQFTVSSLDFENIVSNSVNSISIVTNYEFYPDEWLNNKGLKFTYAKNESNKYEFQFTKDALKKGYLSKLSIEFLNNDLKNILIYAQPKFDLKEFIQNSFKLSNNKSISKEWVRIVPINRMIYNKIQLNDVANQSPFSYL